MKERFQEMGGWRWDIHPIIIIGTVYLKELEHYSRGQAENGEVVKRRDEGLYLFGYRKLIVWWLGWNAGISVWRRGNDLLVV